MILGKIIDKFPYPEKNCPYCGTKMKLVNAIHNQKDEYHFKALFLDPNPECSSYDEGSNLGYAKIYYSSDDAFKEFNNIAIPVRRWTREDLYAYYR